MKLIEHNCHYLPRIFIAGDVDVIYDDDNGLKALVANVTDVEHSSDSLDSRTAKVKENIVYASLLKAQNLHARPALKRIKCHSCDNDCDTKGVCTDAIVVCSLFK